MGDLAALIWDVDGTLADTERDGHRVAFNKAFSQAGLAWHWDVDLYGKLLAVTGGKERIRYYLERFNPDWESPSDLDRFIADLHRRKSEIFVSLMEEGQIPPRNGVIRLINEAAEAGLRLAIATTTTPANVDALLERFFGASNKQPFEVIAAGDIVPAKKPAPDIYRWALEKMDLSADECVAIEDSRNGFESARSAGISTVVITVNGYTADEDFGGASLIVDQLGESQSPATLLGGVIDSASMVDVGLLRRLHGLS
ncbi:HAD family hydrolase [Sedimenticola thiotaurini]|uniref:CbbY n=1 Tax=Sedimenticola thiotaurini TaxID=1543721 RepID=A0A0F7JVR7_9GAMM|nr:HAD family hydrolase [Sedimenticola thiotaurini]AKH19677.1 CbbY [Sedimenticola thiotaurini]